MAAADRRPRDRVTAPRRTISFSLATNSKPPDGLTSTITRWIEFDPRSMAAIFMDPDSKSDEPPPLYLPKVPGIEGAGELVLGSFPFGTACLGF